MFIIFFYYKWSFYVDFLSDIIWVISSGGISQSNYPGKEYGYVDMLLVLHILEIGLPRDSPNL